MEHKEERKEFGAEPHCHVNDEGDKCGHHSHLHHPHCHPKHAGKECSLHHPHPCPYHARLHGKRKSHKDVLVISTVAAFVIGFLIGTSDK